MWGVLFARKIPLTCLLLKGRYLIKSEFYMDYPGKWEFSHGAEFCICAMSTVVECRNTNLMIVWYMENIEFLRTVLLESRILFQYKNLWCLFAGESYQVVQWGWDRRAHDQRRAPYGPCGRFRCRIQAGHLEGSFRGRGHIRTPRVTVNATKK